MAKDIKELTTNCPTCLQFSKQHSKEPMHPHDVPSYAWQKLGSDLFDYKGNQYLLIADYNSKFPVIRKLQTTTSSAVINHMKFLYAELGIPRELVTDNDPQYSSKEFKSFCEEWRTEHTTSSPTYPQSNGFSECIVQTIKNILKKSKTPGQDPYLGLLTYRTTPVDNTLESPARLLNKRDYRTQLPSSDEKHNYPEAFLQHEGDKQETFPNSPLHEACRKGNLSRVRLILHQGLAYVNIRDEKHGRTPLMVAAQEGHCRIFDFLIRQGANMSEVDNDCNNVLQWAWKGGHVGMKECVLRQYSINISAKNMRPLMQAAMKGYRDVAEFLVSIGSNVSQVNDDGNNALHFACRGGHLDVVKYLLSHTSVDINRNGNMGRTPLMVAVIYGYRDVCELLMQNGADVSHVDDNGDNVLHLACKGGQMDVVKYLLSQASVDINTRGKGALTPLMVAVTYGHNDVFKFLMRNGANASQVDDYGNNVLHLACRSREMDVVKYLLSQTSVDINRKGDKGRTPLMVAVIYKYRDVFEFLMQNGADVSQVDDKGDNVLHCACLHGQLGVVKHLLSQTNIEINRRGKDGRTPLMVAVIQGLRYVMELLIRNGADVSQVDEEGNNVLHLACKFGLLDVVEYLLSQNSVDINTRGRGAMTPLMMAVVYRHSDVFKFLMRNGADVSQVDDYGCSVLHLSCRGREMDVVKYLLSQSSIDINKKGDKGMTPVMVAVICRYRDVLEFLMQNGADVSQVDDSGHNILHLASQSGRVEMVNYILSQNRVDIKARDNGGKTAAMIAKSRGKLNVYNLLVSRGCPVK
ncbi:ankyrin repeat domain-containing protein 50-like [Haliotis asinina]|uniref:ankyrin repeat domain-containing protein 50-like n=1 Tax=Haliotis asinina TaxID=109174 RepID=UPI0035326726